MLVGAPERGGTKTEEGQERAPKHWSPSGQSKPTPNPDVTTTLDTYVVAQFAPQLAPPPRLALPNQVPWLSFAAHEGNPQATAQAPEAVDKQLHM